jgi:CRISPR type III-associated protein (TIGR04423 family)
MDDRWLKFIRYWEEKEDRNCMDMPVLTLTKNVFIGFDERKEDIL